VAYTVLAATVIVLSAVTVTVTGGGAAVPSLMYTVWTPLGTVWVAYTVRVSPKAVRASVTVTAGSAMAADKEVGQGQRLGACRVCLLIS
jgi:hypothetical protein